MFDFILVAVLAVLFYKFNKRLNNLEIKLGIARQKSTNEEGNGAEYKMGETKAWPQLQPSAVTSPSPVSKTPTAEPETLRKPEKSFEELIGKRWLPLLGIGAVVVGASFFLKYAFENDLIGVTGRVVLGLLAGLILVGLGEYWRERYEKYSWVLIGGGIALFYLSIYAAYSFYHLIGQPVAFGFMIAVTTFAAVLAVWHRATLLMMVAMLGGYFTPFLLPAEKPELVSLLLYCAVLNIGFLSVTAFRRWRPLMVLGIVAGFIVPLPLMGQQNNVLGWFIYLALFDAFILAVAIFKKWRLMNLLGLLGSMVVFVAWYNSHYAAVGLATTEIFLSVLFIEYLIATVTGALMAKEKSRADDLGLLLINAGWYFAWSYHLLKPNYEAYLGSFSAIMAMIYLGIAYGAIAVKKIDSYLILSLGGIALVFLTLVFPIQLHGYWITVAWAVESVALAVLGVRVQNQKIRLAALVVMILALVRLFLFDTAIDDILHYTILLNKRFFSYAVVIIALVTMKYVFGSVTTDNPQSGDLEKEKSLGPILASVGNILLLIILSLEVVAFFDSKILRAMMTDRSVTQALQVKYYNNHVAIFDRSNNADIQSFANQRNATLSVLWALYATIVLIVGMVRRHQYLRYGALGLFGITLGKVLFVDLAVLPTLYRFISLILVGTLLLVGAYFYHGNKSKFLTN